jgi:MFS transporter, AAHS family, 4-hydroxybenzoate transporter
MTLEEKIRSLIDPRPMSAFQTGIVALCFVMNMNDGIDVLLASFTASEIAKEWNLTNSQLGLMFSAGLVGMTIGCFGIAPWGDKIGRRKVFQFSTGCIAIGMMGMCTASAYWQVLAWRFITGLGIGGILPTMATVVAEYSNAKSRDFNVGLIQGGWPLGAIFIGLFCTWAIPVHGWRFAYLITGIVAVILFIAVWLFMPESLPYLSNLQPPNALQKINVQLKKMQQPVIHALLPKPLPGANFKLQEIFLPEYKISTIRLWIGIFFGFMTMYTLMSWVPAIAKNSGMPFNLATYVGMAFNLGAFLGVIAMGIVVSVIGSRKTLLLFMTIACATMILYANSRMTYAWMMALIFLIGFFVQGGFNAFFPTATRIYPSQIRSTGVGLAFGIGRFGAILGPFLFGLLTDAGFKTNTLFVLFSLPLLIAGGMAFLIPSKNIR